jgi:hypothetical protein
VSAGGAGFVCDNDLKVKKITAGGASEAAGVPVGAMLVTFQGKLIPAGTTWGDFKDICKSTPHPWKFNFAAAGTVPAVAPATSAVAKSIVVTVSEGGAGFVCTPDLTVKKVTAGGASEAAGVELGMQLAMFKAGRSIWSKQQEPNMTWASMKDLCKASPYPWAFTFVPAGTGAVAAAPRPQPAAAAAAAAPAQPPQRRQQKVQEVDGHEWVEGGPGGFSVKFDFTPNDATAPAAIEPHLVECTTNTEHLIKAEEMQTVLALTRARSVKPSDANDIILWLANRLCEPSVNVKLKCLFVLKKFLADGSTTMQVVLRGKSKIPALRTGSEAVDGNLKAVLSFRVPPHAEHGDKPLQMLHKTCRVVQQLLAAELTSELSRARHAIDTAVRAEEAQLKADEEEAARIAADAAYKGSVEQKKAEMSAKVRAQKAEAARKLEEQRAKERQSRGLASMTWSEEPAAPAAAAAAAPAPAPPASVTSAAPAAKTGESGGLFDDDGGGLFGTDADDDVEPTNLFAGSAVTVTADEVDDMLAAGGDIDDDADLQAAEEDLFAGDDDEDAGDNLFTAPQSSTSDGDSGGADDLFGGIDGDSGADDDGFSLFGDDGGAEEEPPAPAPAKPLSDLFAPASKPPPAAAISSGGGGGGGLVGDSDEEAPAEAPVSAAASQARSALFGGGSDEEEEEDLFSSGPKSGGGGLFDEDDEDAAE